jgi:hypothetical protein
VNVSITIIKRYHCIPGRFRFVLNQRPQTFIKADDLPPLPLEDPKAVPEEFYRCARHQFTLEIPLDFMEHQNDRPSGE